MPEPFPPLPVVSARTPDRPLGGVTILLVEDSRFSSEAVRLICLRSGARIRRADSLRAAERHLATYRPTVALIDLGLPDGSGLDLIRRLACAVPRLPGILATSGDDTARFAALTAGADGFLAKPCNSLAAFQNAVLSILRFEGQAFLPAGADYDLVRPDPLAYRDDLAGISELLSDCPDVRALAYAARFLAGVAQSADDPPLADAAACLSESVATGSPATSVLARVAGLVEQRLQGGDPARRIA